MLYFCQFTTQSSCYKLCRIRVGLKGSRFSSGKAAWRQGQQSPGRDSPRRLSWRRSGTDQKGFMRREDLLWHLLGLVLLFLLSDFLGKLPCLCQQSRVWSYLRTDTGVTSSHCHSSTCPKEWELPPPLRMAGLQVIVWAPNANSSPSLPLQTHPFPSTPSPRHICPCLWQPLTALSPQLHKPPLKCSPMAPHWASPHCCSSGNTLCPPLSCFPWLCEHPGDYRGRKEETKSIPQLEVVVFLQFSCE